MTGRKHKTISGVLVLLLSKLDASGLVCSLCNYDLGPIFYVFSVSILIKPILNLKRRLLFRVEI